MAEHHAERAGQSHAPSDEDRPSGGRRRAVATRACAIVLLAVVAGGLAPAVSASHSSVPVPDIDGPTSGGIRTGRPWYASWDDVRASGYTEEEFVVSGRVGNQAAPYRTRLHVVRPAAPERFNGTVVVEWANVSSGYDTYPIWANSSDHLLREGFAYAAISAQKGGVNALIAWDPVRYGALVHPGDSAALAIFSQAALALVEQGDGDPDPMGSLEVRHLIATGASQSAGFLRLYLASEQPVTRLFGGFVPMVAGGSFARDVAPTLAVLSEREANPAPADGGLFAAWEVAGAAHVGNRELSHDLAVVSRDLAGVGGTTAAPLRFDRDDAEQYGERGGSPCPRNFMPVGYVFNAAISRMHDWLTTGTRPLPQPRLARDAGKLRRDGYGNVVGGLRLPPMEVPIAAYNGERCSIFGETVAFERATLDSLYPTHTDYVAKMRTATDRAVADGYLVPADAEAMMARATASTIGQPAASRLAVRR